MSNMSANVFNSSKGLYQSSYLIRSKEKLSSLYYNENFSDLTIRFPGQSVEYKAHKLIMAVSSSIFEGMLFGPMAIKGSELELPDDNPEAFKIVLSSCYEVDIEPSDLDVALDVYMLADKYFMEHLGKKCALRISKFINSENVNKVIEFTTHFNFDSLKITCLQAIFGKFDLYKILLALPPNIFKELLESKGIVCKLEFQDSWRYPDKILCDDIVMEILKSNCSYLPRFSGCVSAKVVRYILSKGVDDLCISIANHQQAKEVISVFHKDWYNPTIHLQCNKLPADLLMGLHLKPPSDYQPDLCISGVDDHAIKWVATAAFFLTAQNRKLGKIYFPESKLTFNGIRKLTTKLERVGVGCEDIYICSSELPSSELHRLNNRFYSNSTGSMESVHIVLCNKNDDIPGW